MPDRIEIVGNGDRITVAEGAPGVGGASGVITLAGLDGELTLADIGAASTTALTTGLATKPTSLTVDNIEVVTRAAYDAIVSPAATTVFVIVG